MPRRIRDVNGIGRVTNMTLGQVGKWPRREFQKDFPVLSPPNVSYFVLIRVDGEMPYKKPKIS